MRIRRDGNNLFWETWPGLCLSVLCKRLYIIVIRSIAVVILCCYDVMLFTRPNKTSSIVKKKKKLSLLKNTSVHCKRTSYFFFCWSFCSTKCRNRYLISTFSTPLTFSVLYFVNLIKIKNCSGNNVDFRNSIKMY